MVTLMKLSFALAILVSLLLLFSGCTEKTPAPTVAEEPTPVINATNTTKPVEYCDTGNIVQKDECFFNLAKQKNSPTYCKSIYSIETLDSCLNLFSADLTICKSIGNADMRASCLTKIAQAQESEEICALIDNSESRLACLEEVLPACSLVTDPDEKALCLALNRVDSTLCNGDSCLFKFAVNTSNAVPCGMISAQAERYACIAVVGKDVSMCLDAELAPVQDSCVELASEALDSLSGCDLARSDVVYRNRCYNHFAVKYGQMDICKKPGSETARDACYKNYSIEKADSSACSYVVESINNRGCYYQSAAINRMPSLCNPLENTALREDCFRQAIYIEGGPVPFDCTQMQSTTWKDKCLLEAARLNGNSSLCKEITNQVDHSSCNFLFGLSG